MRIKRHADVSWQGGASDGGGRIGVGSGAFEGPFTQKARVEDAATTNPEELIGAAHAGCFTMSVANLLEQQGTPAEDLRTRATVYLERPEGRFTITRIELAVTGRVEGVDAEAFEHVVREAKETCPVSRALAGVEHLEVTAELEPR